jgi:hypothetical protein
MLHMCICKFFLHRESPQLISRRWTPHFLGGSITGFVNAIKRHSKNERMRHLIPQMMCPLHRGIQQLYPKWVSHLSWGLPKIRVLRQNPSNGLETPRATRVRDEATQRVVHSWRIRSPIEGTWHPHALYLSLDREVSFTLLHVGWHRAILVFPPGLDLIGGH